MRDLPLPEAALPAWQAYNAMDATKQRHFLLLQGLERKYRDHGSVGGAERALLERLLRDHDRQVARFREAVGELSRSDPTAHQALIGYIADLNDALAPFLDANDEPGAQS